MFFTIYGNGASLTYFLTSLKGQSYYHDPGNDTCRNKPFANCQLQPRSTLLTDHSLLLSKASNLWWRRLIWEVTAWEFVAILLVAQAMELTHRESLTLYSESQSIDPSRVYNSRILTMERFPSPTNCALNSQLDVTQPLRGLKRVSPSLTSDPSFLGPTWMRRQWLR